MSLRLFAGTSMVLSVIVSPASAADPTYWQDVRPILRKHCTVCHCEKNLTESDVSDGRPSLPMGGCGDAGADQAG